MSNNKDPKVVNAFGQQWSHFDQSCLPEQELQDIFDAYFLISPWDKLPKNSIGLDIYRLWKWAVGKNCSTKSWTASLY